MADKDTTLLERLSKIQTELKVPKGQENTFGRYKYRNAEDILEAVKPLLAANGLVLTLSDELVNIGDRYYVKATALLNTDDKTTYRVEAYAREEEDKKGMDGSQITGAASSYARKYALNGLFLIDDTKDSDATNDHGKTPKPAEKPVQAPPTVSTGLIHPALTKEMKQAFVDAQIGGEAALAFARNTIGKERPQTNEDAQKLIDALKELTQ